MGRRGPRPKPTKLKALAGNPGKRKLASREPNAPPDPPGCPAWLSPIAKVEWVRITPLLDRMGLLSAADEVTLAAYCQAAAELIESTSLLNAEGRVVDQEIYSRNGDLVGSRKVGHPAVRMQRDAFTRVKQFLAEFGLSPASRVGLQTPGKADEHDPLEDCILTLNAAG